MNALNPERLILYFGGIGILSMLCWLAAALLLAGYAFSRIRTRRYVLAFVLSVIGLALALLNSRNVSAIRVDRSKELEEARKEQLRLREEEREQMRRDEQSARSQIRFAEERPEEALDTAGRSPDRQGQDAESNPYEEAAREGSGRPEGGVEDAGYVYRREGKKQRAEGKKRSLEELRTSVAREEAAAGRLLPEEDVIRANVADRWNLFFARTVLSLAVLLVLFDYLSRFNQTFRVLFPLPIGGRTMDRLLPKTRSVLARRPASQDVARYLRTVVRKGETFIYFGPEDPLSEVRIVRLGIGAGRRKTSLSLNKICYDEAHPPASTGFVFESAWFDRCAFCVVSDDLARRLLTDLQQFLQARLATRAWARKTVHVVWDIPAPFDPNVLQTLIFLCRETGFKLVVFATYRAEEGLQAVFEEVIV
ncbi:MAG: hypothetical protein HYU36_10990 [Planctomycetes bacterium]|nr:hypothetical protein [Planctomycetota bacterium]